jgi:replicative DNA helicase
MNKMQLRSEQLVINCLLSEPSTIHTIMSSVSSDMFEFPEIKLIFESMSSTYISGEPINLISIYKELSKSKSLNKQKALDSITSIFSMFTPSEKMELPTAISFLIAETVRHEHIDLGLDIKS